MRDVAKPGLSRLALGLSVLVCAGSIAGRAQAPRSGEDRLWAAVESLHPEAVESLLRAGQPPDPRRGSAPGETPLLYVTSRGCTRHDPESKAAAAAIALVLIRHKADVNAVGENRLTPFLHAAYACPPDVVVAMMQAGADARARTAGDATALELAIVDDRADNVKAMIDAGYDVARERAELPTYLSDRPQIRAMLDQVLARSAPPEPEVQWQGLDVRARLDAAGVLHVTEQVSLTATGDVAVAERFFRTAARVSRVGRVDASAREAKPFAPGPLIAANRYEVPDSSVLRWSLRGPRDPIFAAATALTYSLEYTAAGAVIPTWGVRPFGTAAVYNPYIFDPRRRAEELWQAWRLALGPGSRPYVFDHQFSPFLFLGSKPVGRFSLEMTLDPVWGVSDPPRREQLQVLPDDDLRVFIPLEFRAAGGPATVDRTRHIVWLSPLVLLPLASLVLWGVLFLRQWRRRRRYDRTPVDENWIRAHVLTRTPAEIEQIFGATDAKARYPGAAVILERMAREVKVEFNEQAGGTLRLRASREGLPPCERALVGALFGGADVIERERVQARLKDGTLDLDAAARPAFEAAHAGSRWPSPLAVLSFVLIALAVGLTISDLEGGGFQALAVGLVLGSLLYNLLHAVAKAWGASPGLPVFRLTVLIVAPVVFSAAAVVFFLTVPTNPWVIVGLTSLWLGFVNSVCGAARPPWSDVEVELRYGLARARRYIAAELRRPYTQLDGRWLPWVLALGLEEEAATWSPQAPGFSVLPDTTAYAAGWAAQFLGRADD